MRDRVWEEHLTAINVYFKIKCEYKHDRWMRSQVLAEEEKLREKIRDYFDR